MRAKTLGLVAVAFCAGLFVSVVPMVATDVAAGPAKDSDLAEPSIVMIDEFAAMWASSAARGQGAVDGRRLVDSWSRKTIRVDGWPYCDPACQRGGQETDGAHDGLADHRSVVKNTPTTRISVNRTHKSDRLHQELAIKPNPTLSPSTEPTPALPKPIPLGCDPAFSSVADPAHAHIYKRCMT